ncbi:MAG: zinc ribbon domain-containing protein, partial [Dehalococcoidia bacterium]|nr:zinc ribbon domain-containing protein [Dehalococcoidia bacterium]
MICPSCTAENRDTAAFCRECGTALAAYGTPPSCPNCGNALTPGAAFCRQCGAKVAARTASATVSRPWLPWAGIAAAVVLVVAAVTALLLLNSGDEDEPANVAPVGDATPAPSATDAQDAVPLLTGIVASADPADPLIERYEFEPTEEFPVTAIEFLGDKSGDTAALRNVLIHDSEGGITRMAVGDEGLVEEVRTPDGTVFRLEYEERRAIVHVMAPDGEHGAAIVPYEG